jgi:short-subunit dehydrogenase
MFPETQESSQMPENQTQNTDHKKWALVTGASAGIGQEFCRQLASSGYQLVLVARREYRLQNLATELQQAYGTQSLVIPADLSAPGASAEITRKLEAEGIDIEFLVNNAGYGLPGRFTDNPWRIHEEFIQLMVTAMCELTHHLLPAMQRNKKGYIVNVSSVAGLVPASEAHTLYGASKSFLVMFSESLALENKYHNVIVSALCPGFTHTEFHDVNGMRSMSCCLWH